MAHGLNLHDGTGVIARDPSLGVLLAYGRTVPANNAVGYAPGCRFIKTDSTSIGTTEYVNIGTKAAANFQAAALNGLVTATFSLNGLGDTAFAFFVADRAYTIVSITARVIVADTNSANGTIRRVPSGTAIASGTQVHTTTIGFGGTANANQVIPVTSSALPSGSAIGISLSAAAATAARGIVTVVMIPA